MPLAPKLRIVISSASSDKRLIAEIEADGQYVGHISQEKGKDNLDFVYEAHGGLPCPPSVSVPLTWFLDAIAEAKARLLDNEAGGG